MDDLNTRVFRKMGWKLEHELVPEGLIKKIIDRTAHLSLWVAPSGEKYEHLLPISSSWEVCAKYLVPFMRERGFKYHISEGEYFWWRDYKEKSSFREVRNHKIALAACEAFLEVTL